MKHSEAGLLTALVYSGREVSWRNVDILRYLLWPLAKFLFGDEFR